MDHVPRHHFLSERLHPRAYHQIALPIGEKQIMLPAIITATMLEALALTGYEQVLEIGTGSGYLTAVLEQLSYYVFSLERAPLLAETAAERLHYMGYERLDVHIGDGSQGLPDMAPFHAIIVTAAVPRLPRPLGAQIHPDGGRMIIPVGNKQSQHLQLVTRYGHSWQVQTLRRVQIPPLWGRFGYKPPDSHSSASV
jgi:protein-L-isoaspartate(D-aspartate) O-methyltransferase